MKDYLLKLFTVSDNQAQDYLSIKTILRCKIHDATIR